MISALMGQEITVVVRGLTGPPDRLGKQSVGDVSSTAVLGRLETAGADETTEYATAAGTAYLPEGTAVDASSVLEYRGQRYAVAGPVDHRSLPGWPQLDHIIVKVKAVGP